MRKWILNSVGMLDQFIDDIRKAIKEDLKCGHVTIAVEPKIPSRSEQQHRLYRVWCRFLASESGKYMHVWDEEFQKYAQQKMDEDAWHDMLRYAYLPSRLTEVDGRKITILTSTKSLTITAMNEYMSRVEALASRMDMKLPIPRECEVYREYKEAS